MRRFFVKNLFFVFFVNVLVMPVWVFFIDNTVQNRVGAQEFGLYASYTSLALIFTILLDFGITNYNTRTIAQDPTRLNTIFPSMLLARVLLIVAYTIILLSIGIASGYNTRELLLLFGIILIQAITNLVAFIRSNVTALHHFKTDSILSVMGRLLMIVVCGFLLIYPPTAHHFKIEWFVGTQVVSYLLTAVIAMAVLYKLHPVKVRFSFHWPTLLGIMKSTLPYASVIFLMTVYTRSDMWLVKELCGSNGKEQAGIYYAAYRWLDVGNQFAIMFSSILLPLFGRMLAEKQSVHQIVQLCVNLLLPISFMVCVGAGYFGDGFMHWRYSAATPYYTSVFRWVMCSFPAICMMYVYSTLLLANGQLKTLNVLAVGGTILNIALNMYIIPRYQALGAGATGFITQTCMTAGFITCCIMYVGLEVRAKWALAHAGYLLLIIVFGYFISMIHSGWMAQAGLFVVVCMGAMFAFRFVSPAAVKQLLSKRQQQS